MGLSNKSIRDGKKADASEGLADEDLMGSGEVVEPVEPAEPQVVEPAGDESGEVDPEEITGEDLTKKQLVALAQELEIPEEQCRGLNRARLMLLIEGVHEERINSPGVEPDEIPLMVNELWEWLGKVVTIRAVRVDEGEVKITVAWQDRFENMPKSVTLPESRFRVEAKPHRR